MVDKQFDTAPDIATWLEIVKYLQEKHTVNLFCRYKYKKLQFESVHNDIQYFKSSKIPYLNRVISYLHQLKNYEQIVVKYLPDLVLFNTKNFFLIQKAANIKKKYNYKLILDIRSLVVTSSKINKILDEYFFRKTLKLAAEFFDGITYITKEMENYCKQKYSLKKHRSAIWTSGVNVNLFKPKDQNFTKCKNELKLIYHGTVACNRGIQNVLKAISQFCPNNIYFSILGSGKGITKIIKLIKQYKVSKVVQILDRVPYKKVPLVLNRHDIGILPFPDWPGWNTSSPIKLFEYLACGIPVIATRIPSHNSVLNDKNFVFWANSASPQDIGRAIKLAYERRTKLTNYGNEGRKFIVKTYTWRQQGQKLESFIKSIS